MKLLYPESELGQRSPEWLKMRETCLGGSDMATVLGLSPYERPLTLWKRRTGRRDPKRPTAAMERGTELEREALAAALAHLAETGEIAAGAVCEQFFAKDPERPHLGVSFDAVAPGERFLIELKCPARAWNFRAVFTDGVPDHYYPQIQLQLHIARAHWGIEQGFFVSYFPDGAFILDMENYREVRRSIVALPVEYDARYAEAMCRVADLFWEMVRRDEWDQTEYRAALARFEEQINEN